MTGICDLRAISGTRPRRPGWDGDTHDLAAGRGELGDLLQGRVHGRRSAWWPSTARDGRVSADRSTDSDVDLTGERGGWPGAGSDGGV